MENTTPICAMLVDTNVENEEEFEEVGRDQDVPPLTVSTNYISNTSEQLQMGSHSGMTNPIRCKKCTNCIIPTCIVDDKDIICSWENGKFSDTITLQFKVFVPGDPKNTQYCDKCEHGLITSLACKEIQIETYSKYFFFKNNKKV